MVSDSKRLGAFFDYRANGGDDIAFLRAECDYALGCLGHEISENQRLRSENDTLQAKCAGLSEALKPFAKAAASYDGLADEDEVNTVTEEDGDVLKVGDLRRAKSALANTDATAGAMVDVVRAAEPFGRWHEIVGKAECLERMEAALARYYRAQSAGEK